MLWIAKFNLIIGCECSIGLTLSMDMGDVLPDSEGVLTCPGMALLRVVIAGIPEYGLLTKCSCPLNGRVTTLLAAASEFMSVGGRGFMELRDMWVCAGGGGAGNSSWPWSCAAMAASFCASLALGSMLANILSIFGLLRLRGASPPLLHEEGRVGVLWQGLMLADPELLCHDGVGESATCWGVVRAWAVPGEGSGDFWWGEVAARGDDWMSTVRGNAACKLEQDWPRRLIMSAKRKTKQHINTYLK